MTNTGWEVTYFKVSTTTPDSKTDSLYANGNMQVPVVVSIKAVTVEKGKKKRYTLTDGDLSQIELVDYYATTSFLSDGWSYTDQKNDLYSNSLNASAATVKAAIRTVEFSGRTALDPAFQVAQSSDDSPKTRTLWVSTTKVENKNTAARIKQPNGTTITTISDKYQSFVTLTGKTPVAYTTDNVDFVREDTNNGTYKYEWESWGCSWNTDDKSWNQDNYFVSSKGHKFVKVDIHDYDISGYDSGHPGDSRLKNCYAYCAPDKKNLMLSFIWDFGSETTKDAGLYKEGTNVDERNDIRGRKAHAYPNIKINQKINALCLTRLAIYCPDEIWGSEWSNKNCGFTVYDMYGNTGKFSASFTSDHDRITIYNAN